MAKRKTSKAKASRPVKRARAAKASQRKRPPVDPVTGHYLLFDPVTGEPTQRRPVRQLTAKEQAKRKREENERCDASRARRAAWKAAYEARLSQRPAEMRARGFRLPDEVQKWLAIRMERVAHELCRWHDAEQCFRDPWGGRSFFWDRDDAEQLKNHDGVCLASTLAFVQGCMEGYIEGYLQRLQVDRRRSATGNRGKRQAPVRVHDTVMSRDERDELMAADYAELCEIMSPTRACMELASRWDFESWQGVRKALKKYVARQAR